ncbi:MAG: hypothetical protein ACXWPM_12130, partial [Bdellovibrionota bacterium]
MFPFTFPLFLGGSLGFFFAAWSYGFPLVAGERIWPAPAAFAWMLIGVAAGFLPGLHRVSKKILVLIFLLTAGLSLLSIRNLNSSVSWYLAIGLIPCVFWGAAAVGTTLSELLLGFTAAIAIGRGIVLPFSGFLGASLVLAASSAASIVRLKATPDTGKSKPALWSTFALAALVLFNWQRCCIYSSGSTLPA